MSDDEDEYVLNDEELEAEKEEVDDEESVANNEEKDDDEEEDDDSGEENEDQKEEETKIRDLKPKVVLDMPQPVVIKPLSSNVQSVIKETQSKASVSSNPAVVDCVQEPNHIVNQRLLPSSTTAETASLAIKQETSDLVGTPEKRKRQPHLLKKALSPNLPVDFGGSGGYPHPPDATKVVSTSPPIHGVYNRPPLQGGLPPTGTDTTVGFKPLVVTQPPGSFPVPPTVPYRTVNKIASSTVTVPAPPAYLPAQVQQVYQAPPPPPDGYSPYPINYSAANVPLPPPPPAIAFRNVVAPSPQEPTLLTQQPAGVVSGDSEFGGLVSYFSSQQEDDFDT